MTDLATVRVIEHCSDHKVYEPLCNKCRRANAPDKRGAPPLSKAEMSRQIQEIISAARRIGDLYSDLYDISYEKQVTGENGGGGGIGRPTEAALVNGQSVRERLMEASDKIAGKRERNDSAPGALALVAGALNAIDEAMNVVDFRHAATFDPAEQLRERPADRKTVLDSYRRKLRRLRAEDDCLMGREARLLESEIAKIEKSLDDDEKAKKAAQAKADGKTTQSKGSARRARNGWTAR